MSSNLVKQYYMVVKDDEKRVIDTNSLAEQRIREYSARSTAQGFVPGLAAEEIVLPPEEDSEELFAEGTLVPTEEAHRLLEQAKEEAAAILGDARVQAMKIVEDAKGQAQVEKNSILAEARQQGYTEGTEEARKELEKALQGYRERETLLEQEYDNKVRELEPMLVETIAGAYEHIFQVELSSYKGILLHLIETVLRKGDGPGSYILHVSTDDYPYISGQKDQILQDIGLANVILEVVEDVTVSANECMIETENGIFDCGLGTQLSELKKKLMLLAWSGEE